MCLCIVGWCQLGYWEHLLNYAQCYHKREKGWDLSLLWVHPSSIVCVHVYTCATLETDTRHGFQLTVKEAACFRCFLNSLTILVPHFSSITFNVSNQRVWTREWKPSFYEDNTLHCALHGLYFISRNTHTWWSVFDLKEIVQSKMKMLFLHDFLSWNTKG